MDAEQLKKLLQDAEKRAEQAEKRQQKERERAEEAERGRQSERQRAEEQQQRAEEQQQRAEEQQQRAEEQQQRAETTRRNNAPRNSNNAPRNSNNAPRNSNNAPIEQRNKQDRRHWMNPDLTSKGSITNPRDKWCPQSLRSWSDFLEIQRIVFGSIYDTFPTEERVFENRNFLAGLGSRNDSKWRKMRGRAAFELGDGVIFENHPHALSEVADEVIDSETPATASAPPRTPDYRRDLNKLRPDQICVYRSDNTALSRRTMIYISEYKPPHKLTAPHLRVGLRDMDIYKEVVNRKTIPTAADPDALFRYHAERLTASAITQTYHYMIESGLEYGLLTTGEAIVFLKVDWGDPTTLYYHLAEPAHEVMPHPTHFHICTAVGQYLAFTLLALGSPRERRGHGQDERDRARTGLKTWNEDFETTLRSIPASARSAPDSSSDYAPTTYGGVDRSPLVSRRKTRQYYRDHPDEHFTRQEDREPSDDESMSRPPDTPTPLGRGVRQTTRRSERQAYRTCGGGSQQQRQYCTQKCLLGMVNGRLLDPKCPNLLSHNKGYTKIGPGQHPVSHSEFLRLLERQLKDSLDDGITPLGVGGARGVLFQVSLLVYGYTFIS
ncbi:Protein kinase-like domain protein [Beauveria brongniartii RCEF 3172]|uniref:Protein kinase-like domain protein n=1 Tax=Beauveria brongniartii RCEF 3172 TaxID=1081107 RepID=A0A167AUC1_9HYPO|nr:Protein kinase-like domain protein [Beauveria brongniartii RCEF 3172]